MALPFGAWIGHAWSGSAGQTRQQVRGRDIDAGHDRRAVTGCRKGAGPCLAGSLVLGALVLSGCTTSREGQINDTGTPFLSTGQNYRFTEVNADRFRPWSTGPMSYRVGPGDKLKVKYFITREMDEDLVVSPDGTIAPRAIGQLQVNGMTLKTMETAIRKESRKELVDQKVVVALEDAAAPKVYIGGMVARPAVYQLDSTGIGVLQGILLAGGIAETGRTTQVAVIRRGPDNLPMLRVVNVQEIIETGHSDSDVPLMAGDIVFVPYSAISEVNLWIDQFINKVVPFQRQFSYTIGTYSQSTGGTNPFSL